MSIIVALDVPKSSDIPQIVESLPEEIDFYKVGLEIFTAEGPKCLEYLNENKKRIFLDLKLHDIPRTVANAVTSAAQHNVGLLTVHACGGRAMLKAAAEAAAKFGDKAPKLLAITTLTSLDQSDLEDLGIHRSVAEHTAAMGKLAIDCGIDGLVCSALEVGEFRRTLGSKPILVTPGIRPSGASVGDQKRVATPSSAIKDGASYLVIGRPIVQAENPFEAATAILKEVNAAKFENSKTE
jgi:orotidine-5'-phosphate decarboxylase